MGVLFLEWFTERTTFKKCSTVVVEGELGTLGLSQNVIIAFSRV